MNSSLSKARKAKNDEFYTQYKDIECEIEAYYEHNKDVFADKTILLPCDHEWNNFTKYFNDNKERFRIKKVVNVGDKDFRSAEVTTIRDEADIIITNPPFSLFREFLAWIVEPDKKFILLGNMNAITYKEVFPLLKENKMWTGTSGVGMSFRLQDSATEFHKEEDGKKYANVSTAMWFTNLDHGIRHHPLKLMTVADNLKHSKHKEIKANGYQKYDNYDAIEVPFTDSIPSDYEGVMGVPISFLNKYCPEQFEIVGMAKRGAGDPALKSKVYTINDSKNYSDLNAGPVLKTTEGLRNTYPRVLIRHRSKQ